jgi:hypothetical protein
LNASGDVNVGRPAFSQVSPGTRVAPITAARKEIRPLMFRRSTPLMKDVDRNTAPIQIG